MTAALDIAGLAKTFDEHVAVDHVDLTVPQGSFYGLVGQNGAGKTTTLSMAVGLLRPDSGTARIFGADVWTDPATAKGLVGVLPDGMAMPERLTGREVLTYLGLLRGLSKDLVAARAEELLSVLELDGAEKTLVIEYSTGHAQEDRLGHGAAARAAAAGAGRAVRGGGSGVGGDDQDDSARVRGRRRLDRALQPCDGAGGAALRPRGGDRQGPGGGRGTAGRGARGRDARRTVRGPGRFGVQRRTKGLSWL